MKAIYKKTLLLFLLIPFVSFASINIKPKHEKTKTIKKEYAVIKNATVNIENKYGNIDITTWNENRVEITVKITVKGNDLTNVEKKLKTISVDFNANTNLISAQTKFDNTSSGWSFWEKSNNTSYKVNYFIKMPVSNNVDLNNDYGSILIDELNGSAAINCDYGKLIIGSLNNVNNSINIDYCNGSNIDYMKAGAINANYSKLTIDKTETVKINADYTTIAINDANTVDFNADYGSIKISEVKNITGNSDYVSIRLGTIYKNLNLKTDYGSIKVSELANGFNNAEIISEYAGITIGTKKTNNFNFMLNLQYGGFRYNTSNVEMFKSIEKGGKKYYEGIYGKGETNATIKIKSQYGSVNFKEL